MMDSTDTDQQTLDAAIRACDIEFKQSRKHIGEQYFMYRGENFSRFMCGTCKRDYVIKVEMQPMQGAKVCSPDESYIVGVIENNVHAPHDLEYWARRAEEIDDERA